MRSLRFLPLTFLAGFHGFVLFAAYMALAMAIAHVIWARRRRAAAVGLRREERESLAFDLPVEAIAGV